ncbi:hypothetical protein AB0H43_13720 [Hamadaea sp. NPDC050747]|uniref:hypothetical protein n=1 Tax=Hamadaea sp. NPDC050747 TaxID=3155789 RepID=UPI0033C91A4F
MSSPTSATRVRRSRRSHNPATTNPDRAAKAVATAQVIGQRVEVLIGHLASLDPQQLAEVAEPVLERLQAVVSNIHQLHTVFEGWAADHAEPINHRDATGQAAGNQSTPSLAGSEPPAVVVETPAPANSTPHQHMHTTSPSGQDSDEPANTCDHPDATSQPHGALKPTTRATATDPATAAHPDNADAPAAAPNSGGPARQSTPLLTVADLRHALDAITDDTPIRILHGGRTYALGMPTADGHLVVIDLATHDTPDVTPLG